jgi:hypothetical protein
MGREIYHQQRSDRQSYDRCIRVHWESVSILHHSTWYRYILSFLPDSNSSSGLRIMTFGVLYDFTGNSNVSKVIKAATMVQQQWFLDAVNYDQPIDLFLLIGHNPVRTTDFANTLGLIQKTIRSIRPATPIQVFGGHSHIRDFQVYDESSTALESGRYC